MELFWKKFDAIEANSKRGEFDVYLPFPNSKTKWWTSESNDKVSPFRIGWRKQIPAKKRSTGLYPTDSVIFWMNWKIFRNKYPLLCHYCLIKINNLKLHHGKANLLVVHLLLKVFMTVQGKLMNCALRAFIL